MADRRDEWETETAEARAFRRGPIERLLTLPDEHKSIREQAIALFTPVADIEENILRDKALPRGEGEEGVARAKSLENLRKAGATLWHRLDMVWRANRHGWDAVGHYLESKLTGDDKEWHAAVEKAEKKKTDKADKEKKRKTPYSKRDGSKNNNNNNLSLIHI